MKYSITVEENGVVVLYRGIKEIGACIGNRNHVTKFIEKCMIDHGDMKVYGENRIKDMN